MKPKGVGFQREPGFRLKEPYRSRQVMEIPDVCCPEVGDLVYTGWLAIRIAQVVRYAVVLEDGRAVGMESLRWNWQEGWFECK